MALSPRRQVSEAGAWLQPRCRVCSQALVGGPASGAWTGVSPAWSLSGQDWWATGDEAAAGSTGGTEASRPGTRGTGRCDSCRVICWTMLMAETGPAAESTRG